MFNQKQIEAINSQGCTLILAGAGSGKTMTMVERIRQLIWSGVQPSQIVALTFSNKAAAEIKSRVGANTNEMADGCLIGTFHSVAVRFLREALKKNEGDETLTINGLTWSSDFLIYDQFDSRSLFEECCKSMGIDKKSIPVYENTVSRLRNQGYGIDSICLSDESSFPKIVTDLFYSSLNQYSESNALGYDEIIWLLVKLLTDEPIICELLRYQHFHFLVDECQDINLLQLAFINLLVYGNQSTRELDWEGKDSGGERSLFFVGDIDQSIYGWRGAEPDLILGLPNSHNAKVLKLEDNYRSIEPILQLANHLIKKNENRIDKILIASRTKEVPVSFEKPINFQWSGGEGDEAIWVAEKIKENLAHGYSPSDILILFRTNSQSRSFEAVLSGESLPYKLVNAFKFYDRKEVRDILGYLIFANNPKQDTILKRIINTPRRGIGGMTMNAIEELAQSRKSSMWEVISNSCSDLNCGAAAKAGIRNFVLIVQSIAQLKLSDTLIQDVIDISGYSKYLESLTQDEMIERSSNLKELQSAIDIHLRSKEPKTISDFLQAIAFNEKTDITDSIKLMTCHSAKGLEFPIVFVTGLEEGTFPSRRSETSLEIEEERRLMYVAITRAQDKLYLSGSSFRYNNHCSPSRFLLEMKE